MTTNELAKRIKVRDADGTCHVTTVAEFMRDNAGSDEVEPAVRALLDHDDDGNLECRDCDSKGCFCGFWEAQSTVTVGGGSAPVFYLTLLED